MADTVLIHILQTYDSKVQKYSKEKFSNLSEIKNFFDMIYLESGEIQREEESKGRTTYFAGKYSKNKA